MKLIEIKNWKLKEVQDNLELVASDSITYLEDKLKKLGIKQQDNKHFHRRETYIDWDEMPNYYKFFFDNEGWEEKVKQLLLASQISSTKRLIITYGKNEPVVKIPVKVFLEDWEGFFASTQWQTLIFSEDFKLIMEVSRDYYLHSNFSIFNM